MLDKAKETAAHHERVARRQRMRRLGARLSYWIVVALAICVTAPWTFIDTTARIGVQNLLFDEYQRWRSASSRSTTTRSPGSAAGRGRAPVSAR